MITPKLEELIHCGKAAYKTFVLGLSGNNVIPVTKGKYIVITDILYYPFTDMPEALDQSNYFDILKKSNKQIEFTSSKSKNHYVIRDSLPNAALNTKIDTYLVHISDVTVNICVIPSLTDAAMTLVYGVAPITEDNKAAPVGYGGLADVLVSANLVTPNEQYQPANNTNSGVAVGADYREQLKVNITNATKLINLNNPIYDGFLKDRTFPIINIGYVLVNEMPNQFLQAS